MDKEIDEETQLLTGVKKTDESYKQLPPKVLFMDRVKSLIQLSILNKNDSFKFIDMLTITPKTMVKLKDEAPSKNSEMLSEPETKLENREHSEKLKVLTNELKARVEHENSEPSKDTKRLASELETKLELEDCKPFKNTQMLTSEPETTTEPKNNKPSEDKKILTCESEPNMELDSPEPSEDGDSENQVFGNLFSDKIKGLLGWNKKKYIKIQKVGNYSGIRKPITLDELAIDSEDFFIENYQYYADLPYLEVRREENDVNSNNNGETEIVNTIDDYAKESSDKCSNNEKNIDIGKSKGDYTDNKNEKVEIKQDTVEVKKDNSNNEDIDIGKSKVDYTDNKNENVEIKKDKVEVKEDNSNDDDGIILENPKLNSYKESNNSNIENDTASNSETEDRRKSIIQIAKTIATTILKAITDTYI